MDVIEGEVTSSESVMCSRHTKNAVVVYRGSKGLPQLKGAM